VVRRMLICIGIYMRLLDGVRLGWDRRIGLDLVS